jgi:hypothetical protein
MCKLAGTVIELPKRQLPVFEDRGDGIGCPINLLVNQLIQHEVFGPRNPVWFHSMGMIPRGAGNAIRLFFV